MAGSITDEEFQKQYDSILDKCSDELHPLGCIEWKGECASFRKDDVNTYGKKNVILHNTDGVVVVASEMTAHRASLGCHEKSRAILESSDEASHLCHNTKCVNPKHLIMEKPKFNAKRKNCVKENACICRQPVKCIFPKFPCIYCKKEVSDNDQAITCDVCDKWQHIACQNIITQEKYQEMLDTSIELKWDCDRCKMVYIPKPSRRRQHPI